MVNAQAAAKGFAASIKEGIQVCRKLFPMIISVVVFVKILSELNLIQYVAMPLGPIMQTMGLPVEFGLVWAAAMLVNIYSSLALIPSILLLVPVMTVEQMTILGLIILIAHSLILETKIAGQCGLSMFFQVVLRIGTAWLAGVIVHYFCQKFGIWQEPAKVLFEAKTTVTTFWGWVLNELINLAQIFVIICLVMMFNKIINTFRISDVIGFLLSPVLRILGISKQATSIVIVGLVLGILYGSGIIIQAATEGRISRADTFSTMSLMSIAHALIEDTIILSLLGGSLWGLLGVRLVFAIVVGSLINFIYGKRHQSTALQKGAV